ncbi:HAD family hydrolase [Arsenicitalea aurantiaca]|nr:HAD family phosphatase [Arsenicitalea aurantiaca]
MKTPLKIAGVLWDIDGTLVDSEPFHHGALVAACAEHGVDLSDLSAEAFIGVHIEDVFHALRDRLPAELAYEVWNGRIGAHYANGIESLLAQPGAVETIAALTQKGILQACVSNSGRAIVDANVKALGIAEHLRFTISLDDLKNGKPHPEAYTTGSERLGLAPRHVLAVEDSATGLRSARAAGCYAVAYWPFPERPVPDNMRRNADRVVRHLGDIPDVIERLAAPTA